MKIRNYKNFSKRRRYVMAKTNQEISIDEILVDEIQNSSTNDWDELCDACSSLIKDAGITNSDIDMIVEKVKKGAI